MEKYLFFLIVFGFAGFIIFGVPMPLAAMATAIVAIVYIAARYPDPRRDWPYTRSETYRFVMLSGFGVLLVILLDMQREFFAHISLNDLCTSTIIIGFITLLILGMVFPSGLRDVLEEKEEE